jgi:hypothetical protein
MMTIVVAVMNSSLSLSLIGVIYAGCMSVTGENEFGFSVFIGFIDIEENYQTFHFLTKVSICSDNGLHYFRATKY